jgi:hypothetical protein
MSAELVAVHQRPRRRGPGRARVEQSRPVRDAARVTVTAEQVEVHPVHVPLDLVCVDDLDHEEVARCAGEGRVTVVARLHRVSTGSCERREDRGNAVGRDRRGPEDGVRRHVGERHGAGRHEAGGRGRGARSECEDGAQDDRVARDGRSAVLRHQLVGRAAVRVEHGDLQAVLVRTAEALLDRARVVVRVARVVEEDRRPCRRRRDGDLRGPVDHRRGRVRRTRRPVGGHRPGCPGRALRSRGRPADGHRVVGGRTRVDAGGPRRRRRAVCFGHDERAGCAARGETATAGIVHLDEMAAGRQEPERELIGAVRSQARGRELRAAFRRGDRAGGGPARTRNQTGHGRPQPVGRGAPTLCGEVDRDSRRRVGAGRRDEGRERDRDDEESHQETAHGPPYLPPAHRAAPPGKPALQFVPLPDGLAPAR